MTNVNSWKDSDWVRENLIAFSVIAEQAAESLANEAERKAQKYYQSCLDVNETMESLGGKPVLDLLTEIGGWPAINEQFSVRHWSFQRTIQITHNQLNMGGFFSWVVAEDDKNSSRHVIQVSWKRPFPGRNLISGPRAAWVPHKSHSRLARGPHYSNDKQFINGNEWVFFWFLDGSGRSNSSQ